MADGMIDSARLEMPEFRPGSVWLVGAGPGDPGLLTALALHALDRADTVVYDALVDRRILTLARPAAVREFAGKRGGKPSPRQPDISARLIRLAKTGKRVLRLKGGDPFTFGRGGEEALALAAAGVPFRIVPGITAGIGGLAYAGIPLTHRDTNSAVTLVTGHASDGTVPDGLDWDAIAKGSPAIVLYMAMKHLATICARLIAAGRAPDEPAAIVSKATTPDQRVLVSTLGEIAVAAATAGIEAPTIVAIGEVVRLRDALDWLGSEQQAFDPDPRRIRAERKAG
ncbi:MAG TPA: uroporphyrinogen-III C-methyltransferase [Stellaceae bacterium]|jgi:uroporphyrin-III C-methyltransferase|nr:uroporphyrinogen-III C-methyltransferase [Stellaceae bacterium]